MYEWHINKSYDCRKKAQILDEASKNSKDDMKIVYEVKRDELIARAEAHEETAKNLTPEEATIILEDHL